jgi:anti-sigma regulatory factor (Ser/Thr protein kinase)
LSVVTLRLSVVTLSLSVVTLSLSVVTLSLSVVTLSLSKGRATPARFGGYRRFRFIEGPKNVSVSAQQGNTLRVKGLRGTGDETSGTQATHAPGALGTWHVDSADIASLMAAQASVMALLRSRGAVGAPYEDCALALAELLSNAMRHANPGGEIEVTLDWTRERPRLAVTNAGEPFTVRLEKPPADRESGRGLFIIAHVVDTPEVAAENGRCTVSVVLPVTKA